MSTGDCKVVTILMSGGVDSTACAYFFKEKGFEVRGVFLDFGQLASQQERRALEKIKSKLNIEIDLVTLQCGRSFGDGELLGRNAFLIISALFICQIKKGGLVLGLHSGTNYYDCSEGFVSRMKTVVEEHTCGEVTVLAPFLKWNKGQVYQYFIDSGLSFELTYSCERGTEYPCGMCLSCKDRSVLGC